MITESAYVPPVPSTITVEQIHYVLNNAARQVQVAMMLSLSTFFVFFMVLAFALQWRKTGFVFAILWGILTAMIPNGHAMVIGPGVAAIGLIALVIEFLRRRP